MFRFPPVTDPLCGVSGNIECWWCPTCQHLFADSEGTQELTEEECFFPSAYSEHDFTYEIGFEEREDRCWLSYPAYYDAIYENDHGVSVTDYFDAVGYSFRYCSHCGAVMVTGYDEEQEFERWNEEFSWLTLHTPGEGDPTEGFTYVPFTPAGLSEGDYWINRPGYLNDRLSDFDSSSQYYAAAEQAVRNAKFYVNKDTGMLRMICGNSVLDYSLSYLSDNLVPDPVFRYLYQLSVIPNHNHFFSVYIQNSTENAQPGEYYYDCEALAEETGQHIYDSGLAVEICNKYDAVQLRGYPFQEIHVFAEEPMFAKYLKIMPGLGEALPFSDEGLADGDYWFDMEGLVAAYQDLEDMSDAEAQQYREATVRLADDGSFLRIANPDFAYHQNRDSRIGTFCSFYLRVKGQDAPACFSPIPTEDSDALAFGDYWFDVDRMLLSDSYLKASERQAYRSATYYLSCNKNLIMADLGDLGMQRLIKHDWTFMWLRQHGDVPTEGFRELAVIAQGETPAETLDWGGWYIDFEAFFEAYLASRSGPAPTDAERQELYDAALARLREKTLCIDRFQRLAAYYDVFSIVTPEMLEPYYDFILPAVRYYNPYTEEAFYPLPTEDSDALEAGQYYYDLDGMRAATSEAYEYWVVNLEDSVWAISPDGSTILADDYWQCPYVPETGTESGDFDYSFLRQHGVEFVCTHKDVELYSNSHIKPVHDTVFISADADPDLQYCTCYYCNQCNKFLFYDASELIAALYLRELPAYGLKYIDAHCDDDDDDGVCDICGGPYYMLTEEPSYQRYYLVVPEEDADLAEDIEVWIYTKAGETRFAFYYWDELIDPDDEEWAEYYETMTGWITAPLVCPGHEWDNGTVTQKATFTEDGVKTFTCGICSETRTESIPKIDSVTLSDPSFSYNGYVQKPTVTVKDSTGKVLTEGTDYTLTWSNANSRDAGYYTVTVTGAGTLYSGSTSKSYNIIKQLLESKNVTLSAASFTYNGAVQKPTVTVKDIFGKTLTEGTHYTVTYSNANSKAAGSYTVTVIGKGNYTNSAKKNYTIKKQVLDAANITLSATSFTYNGAVQQPTVTVKNAAGTKLTEGTSYTLTWSNENSKAPGTYTVTVTAAGSNYSGSASKTYTIAKQPLAAANITLSATSFTYNSAVQKPTVTVKNAAGTKLTEGTSYTLTWSNENSKAPGTYTVTVTAAGNYYSGSISKTYTISKQPLAAANITLSAASFTYNGKVQKPTVTVKNAAGTKLTEGTHYTLTWSNESSKTPGTYTVTVTGTGSNFSGSASKTYTIAKQPLAAANITLSAESFTYSGAVQKPTVTVKNASGKTLALDSAYTLTWSNENSKAPGTYTVTVTAAGNYYSGTVKKTYKIAKQSLAAANITLSASSFVYNAKVQKPTVTVKNAAGKTLTEGTSYTLTWSDESSKSPGTYTVTVTAAGSYYSGTVSKTYKITKQTLKAANITLSDASFVYNAKAQKPTVTVKNAAGAKLTEDTHYTVAYSEGCKAVGSYTVTVTGTGNYAGSVSKTFKITAQPLDSANITLSATSFVYNVKTQKPTVTVKNAAGAKLTEDTHYTVAYSEGCKAVGSYTVTVTGTGNYAGSVSKTFRITAQPLDAASVTLSATSFVYNAKAQKPTVTVKNATGAKLTADTHYTVTCSAGCKAVGSYTVTVTGTGNYKGSVSKTFKITAQPLDAANVTLSAASFVYNAKVQKPTVTVKNAAGAKLTADTHYTVTYSAGCKAAGTYTVTVTGTGNYKGSVSKIFKITAQPLDAANITLSATSFVYNAKVQKPTVTVKNAAGAVLTEGTHYTVAYSSGCKAVGSYTVTVTGTGNYKGSVSKTFKITAQTLKAANVTLSATSFTYNGKVQKPTVTVKNAAGAVLTEGTSYTVTYSAGCKAKGTYTVTITGTGNYKGTVEKTFTIK
ncbi:MAG: hypothetical protein IJK23_09215 [Clostridia bacterium]|nr:hypothetical protein [Clostridia bacterium]